MARIQDPTPEQEVGWKKWVKSRPKKVRVIAERFDPWSLYRLKDTGQRVTLRSISEDGTVSVNITGDFNVIMFDRYVFGIDPDKLEPCELPDESEPIGTVLTEEADIEAFVDMVRPAILAKRN